MENSLISPADVRCQIREGKLREPTSGLCPGYAQANLVVLPQKYAYDFLLFSHRNPKACPLLEVSDTGSRFLKKIAANADIATDLPKYRVYEYGKLTGEYTDTASFWREDFVSFLIGCSFSFESELAEAGIEMRHNTEHCNVPMYLTNIPCASAGVFHGNMVVSMRPIPYEQVVKAVTVTAAIPKVHGAPVHIGSPGAIGIKNLDQPDFGDAVSVKEGEVPVFWACGVTPQAAVMASMPDFCITHAPGHMLITDVKNIDLKE
ncbi:MAG: putative hydro-lyase [Lachnospiraceae bacterium]